MIDLTDYISQHISPEPLHLQELTRRTYLHHVYPRMCCDHIQGRLLKMLTQMQKPKRIVELGAFTGYSALCFAEGMPEDAELHTIEIDEEIADELRQTLASSPWADRIHLHIGDAMQILPTLDGPWDMALIDANKRHYIKYYELLLPRMSSGGLILADNTLWGDKVLDTDSKHDPQTQGILDFNNHVSADPRVEVAMLPLRDGMTMIKVK